MIGGTGIQSGVPQPCHSREWGIQVCIPIRALCVAAEVTRRSSATHRYFNSSVLRQQLLFPHLESLRKSRSQFGAMSHHNENRLLISVQIEQE